jgi:hypothetical protein
MTPQKSAELSIAQVIDLSRDYISRKGLRQRDFAARVGYSLSAVQSFLTAPGKYWGDEQALGAAIMKVVSAADDEDVDLDAPLFETENLALIRRYFTDALESAAAREDVRGYYFRGAPGSQKSFVLKLLSREYNLSQAHKNGSGGRAYYVSCYERIPRHALISRIAVAVGSLAAGNTERILQNLKFHLRSRHCVLIIDEAQGLEHPCLEIVRDLVDALPRCAVIFAGSHKLEQIFAQLNMQQWHSRIRKGTAVPGVQEDEARAIIKTVLGEVPVKKIAGLIAGSYDTDLYGGKVVQYISMRKLANALKRIKSRLSEGGNA